MILLILKRKVAGGICAQKTSCIVTPWRVKQVWPAGWVPTVTLYDEPLAIGLENVNGRVPVPVTVSGSTPLSRRTSPAPVSPKTLPPTVNVAVVQETPTLVTLPLPIVPVAFVRVQVCAGPLGWVATVTV